MLEEIQSWNVLTQLVSGGLLSITVLVILALVFARNNTPVISETSELRAKMEMEGANRLMMFIAEHEAHQINDTIDDKKEAQRLSRLDT